MRGASLCLHRRRAKSRVAKVSGHLPRDVDLELRVLEIPGQFHHITGLQQHPRPTRWEAFPNPKRLVLGARWAGREEQED